MTVTTSNSYVPQLIKVTKDSSGERLIVKGNQALDLMIYNRWGKMAYYAENYKNDWHPNELEEGIYFYQLCKNGITPFTGWILVGHE